MVKKVIAAGVVAGLTMLGSLPAHAADKQVHFSFQEAVNEAIAAGVIDGSVKFYLAGTGGGGTVLRSGSVTNKKTNAVGKSDKEACTRALHSGLISLHATAKGLGASRVTNIVSFFKKKEFSSTTEYECYVGNIMASVALKGDIVK